MFWYVFFCIILYIKAYNIPTPTYKVPSLVDAKYKINEVVPVDQIESLRIRHIELSTEDMALEVKRMIKDGEADFEELAKTMSLNIYTKTEGGNTGWLTINNTPSEFLQLVNTALYMNKGDMTIIDIVNQNTNNIDNSLSSSSDDDVVKTWHVLQLVDVATKLSPSLMKRRIDHFKKLKESSATSSSLTYSIETMGCQMNVADSERIEGQLSDIGYNKVDDTSIADVVILNTCSIRDHAEQKVYSYVGPHALRKRQGDDVAIIVAGCVAQQEGESLTRRFPEVDVVMGPQYANRIGDLLDAAMDGNQVVATDPAYQSEDILPAHRRSDLTAYVNTIYGCNERCTYCVVPNTRGVEQSRTKEAIVSEVEALVAAGYREVTLLGQNIDSWGRDFSPKQRFADLLTAVGKVEGIDRVRFLTSHPKYMSKRVIAAVAENSRLMPCFNIPFQSGDDEVLRNMRRGYSRKRFLGIVKAIREMIPDAAITADSIVGFPGETEEQFQQTLDLMEEVHFESVNTAAYSPRPNTPAAEWTGQLSEEVKRDRLARINRLGAEHALERSSRFLNRIQEVLVEEVNLKRPAQVVGRNEHGRLVFFEGNISELKGKIVPVHITEARSYSLTGEIAGTPR